MAQNFEKKNQKNKLVLYDRLSAETHISGISIVVLLLIFEKM